MDLTNNNNPIREIKSCNSMSTNVRYISLVNLTSVIFAQPDLNSSFFYLRHVAKCVYVRKNNK